MKTITFNDVKEAYENNRIECIDDFEDDNFNSYYLDYLEDLDLYVITQDEYIIKCFEKRNESIEYFKRLHQQS